MANGPTKPPRLPTELITAIDTAAVERVRNSVGNAQNGDLNAYRPARLRQIIAIAKAGLPIKPAPTKASAATPSGMAECNRRSACRSERRDHQIITAVANTYGSMAISPTSVCDSLAEKPLMICGIQ
jgi:hypothetical protein